MKKILLKSKLVCWSSKLFFKQNTRYFQKFSNSHCRTEVKTSQIYVEFVLTGVTFIMHKHFNIYINAFYFTYTDTLFLRRRSSETQRKVPWGNYLSKGNFSKFYSYLKVYFFFQIYFRSYSFLNSQLLLPK